MVRLVALVCAAVPELASAQQRPVDLLITDANVVDVMSGRILPKRSLATRGDTIVVIGGTEVARTVRARQTVNAAGAM